VAAEIESELGVRAELVRGARGVFDVVVDGHLVSSKDREGRFPEPGEVVRLIRQLAD